MSLSRNAKPPTLPTNVLTVVEQRKAAEEVKIITQFKDRCRAWLRLLPEEDMRNLEDVIKRVTVAIQSTMNKVVRASLLLEFASLVNLMEVYKHKFPSIFSDEQPKRWQENPMLFEPENGFLKQFPDLFDNNWFIQGQELLEDRLTNDADVKAICFSKRLIEPKTTVSKIGAVLKSPVKALVSPAQFLSEDNIQATKEQLNTTCKSLNAYPSTHNKEIVANRIRIPAKCGSKTCLIDTFSVTCSAINKSSEVQPDSNNNNNTQSEEPIHYSTVISQPDEILHLVFFVGNFECYEQQVNTMIDYALKLQHRTGKQVQITAFNYPGIVDSEGDSEQLNQYAEAGKAVVQNLIDKGANPGNITLYGHSLGGLVATKTANDLHKAGQPVNIFNSRSLWSTDKFLSKTDNAVGRFIMKNWSIDAAQDFMEVPSENKEWILVRDRKHTPKQSRSEDGVIRHEASLYAGLKAAKKANNPLLAQNPAPGFAPDNTNEEPYRTRERNKEARQERKLIGDTREEEARNNLQGLHNVPLHCLIQSEDDTGKIRKTGEQLLLDFCINRYVAVRNAKRIAPRMGD